MFCKDGRYRCFLLTIKFQALHKGFRETLCADLYIRAEKRPRFRLFVGCSIGSKFRCGVVVIPGLVRRDIGHAGNPLLRCDLSNLCTDDRLSAAAPQNERNTADMAFRRSRRIQGCGKEASLPRLADPLDAVCAFPAQQATASSL